MPTSVSLSNLVDLALGSPEVGAVNFNVLHTLLHAMIQKLNIQEVKADIDEHDRELLSTHTGPRKFSAFSVHSADSGKGDDSFSISEDGNSDRSCYTTTKHSPYHKLEKRVAELFKQMDDLNKLPSNEQLIGLATGKASERPVSDMWQHMQLKRRVDANQEGIDKVMSLVEELMKQMKDLKDTQKDLLDKFNKINIDDINRRLDALDDFSKDMNSKFEGISNKLSNVPNLNDLNQYLSQFVTWPGLEDALKGVRQDFENLQSINEDKVLTDFGIQTETPEPKSRPHSAKGLSRSSSTLSRASGSGGPSNELLDVLEKLGKLLSLHEKLKERVDELERLLALKADKSDMEGLGISEELLTSLKNLKEEVDQLKGGQLKDSALLQKLQEAIQKLLADIDKLNSSVETVIAENSLRVKEIQDLVQYCDNLDARKADKMYVDTEVDVKADRNQLEGKVNHSLFDSTTNELNRMIKDILDKLNGHDGDWKSALAKAMEELDGKLDRREMKNLKDWLEKQLKAINNKIKTMGPGWQLDDEAAGMKKQLIQRFHCLSCDKPINIMPQLPIPSIPSNYGLPKFNSARPYMTYELDQIRQKARSLGMNPEYLDYYASIRQCGGSHTLTQTHKRMSKISNPGQLYREEETIVPLHKEEVDVQGVDGHIYKGRLNTARIEAKLPANITTQHSHHVYVEERVRSPQLSGRPVSAKASRPSSGRPLSSQSNQKVRPASSQVRIAPEMITLEMVAPEMIVPDVHQAGESRTNTPFPEEQDFLANEKEQSSPFLEEKQDQEKEDLEIDGLDA